MSKNVRKVDTSWKPASMYRALSSCYWSYVRIEETEPSVLYCTSNLGALYPHALCMFAIRNGLRLKFIPSEFPPYFYFGD